MRENIAYHLLVLALHVTRPRRPRLHRQPADAAADFCCAELIPDGRTIAGDCAGGKQCLLALSPTKRFSTPAPIKEAEGKQAALSAPSAGRPTASSLIHEQRPGTRRIISRSTGRAKRVVAKYAANFPSSRRRRRKTPRRPPVTTRAPAPRERQKSRTRTRSRRSSGKIAIVADWHDKMMLIARPQRGTVTPATLPSGATPPGGGPRHLDFHPHKWVTSTTKWVAMSDLFGTRRRALQQCRRSRPSATCRQ